MARVVGLSLYVFHSHSIPCRTSDSQDCIPDTVLKRLPGPALPAGMLSVLLLILPFTDFNSNDAFFGSRTFHNLFNDGYKDHQYESLSNASDFLNSPPASLTPLGPLDTGIK